MSNQRFSSHFVLALLLVLAVAGLGTAKPYILLGPTDELALDQPRVAIELIDPQTGQVIGPQLANTFLLDTGANSILAVDDSVTELMAGGYRTEGTFWEQGIGGFTEFDVSAEYDLRYAGSDGISQQLDRTRIMSSTTVSFCPVPGLCSFFGILGMPAMDGRVTTLNLSGLGGNGGTGDPFDILDILDGDLSFDFLGTSFANELPTTSQRRYSVPLSPLHFSPGEDGPLPAWVDLPALTAKVGHQGIRQAGNFVLDTGAQMSLMSTQMALDLGLDANGNGSLLDEAIGTQAIGGVGGQINAPLMLVEDLRIPTDEGLDLVFTDLTIAIADIDPTIDGIFGMNFLSSGWMGSLLGGWGDLSDLFNDAGMGDLLDGLGGIGLGDGSANPLFEKVHFDFRGFDQGEGRMVLDLMPQVGAIQVGTGEPGDVDQDGDVDPTDFQMWVRDLQNTYYGDANLDGQFDTHDMVMVFQTNEYEDGLLENSRWSTGDWNGDYEFDSSDMVLAFQDGGYEQGQRASHAVPEPTGFGWIGGVALLLILRRSRIKTLL